MDLLAIKMKKALVLLACFFTCSLLLAQNDAIYVNKAKQFYSLYEEFLKNPSSNDIQNAEEISNTIRNQFKGLRGKEREGVIDVIISDVVNAFEEQDNLSFLNVAERALFILPQDEPARFDILSVMADVYAAQNNKEMLQATIQQMRNAPNAQDSENDSVIQELQNKANRITAFPKVLNGYWIADRYMTAKDKKGRPWLIIDIYSDNNGKWATISELSGVSSSAFEQEYSKLRRSNSFDFDVRGGSFIFSFYNNTTRRGNAELANSFYDNAQDARASFHALASDNRATLGQAVTAELIGGLFSAINEGLARNAATSRMSEDVIYITGSKLRDDAFKCNLRYQYQASNSATMRTSTQDFINQDFTLYRWNKEDNLVFGLTDCRPISPYLIKLTPDMELYQIKRRTSFWNFKYGGISLLGMAAGAAGIYHGITTLKKEDRSDSDFTTGIVATALGAVATISVPIVMRSIRLNKRKKLVGEYNMREFDRLYEMKSE